MVVDLRSDTVTRPSPAMLEAMASAAVGDDVYGDDPTVNELQAHAASMFNKEAGLFCPSGTMTNQIAIKAHTQPGDELICSDSAHIFIYEGGGIAFNSGVQARCLPGDEGGRIKAAQVESAVNPDDIHLPRTTLVCLENTTNKPGGAIYSLQSMQAIFKVAKANGLRCHLDGARLFNAMVASGHTFPSETPSDRSHQPMANGHAGEGSEQGCSYGPPDVGACFDSISICLSKGLGCPIGSLLLGTHDFIARARRIRKAMGGGMRQAGFLAAAGLYALKHNINRLACDHARAKQLGAALASLDRSRFVTKIKPVTTNIVIFELGEDFDGQVMKEALAARGILVSRFGARLMRFVTHLNTDDHQIAYAIQALREVQDDMMSR
ncbi:threonine aldolase [Dunaliella salina]|uniref:Threonine aldolase n=1 Tax=Dunaliella salina TaxID=3046 RepID=A0ABQ7FYY7_DUNSA|nr:threonine aldolase [Dunaliella salina]|eukprot:KAF5827581.1 threonine aldolase [Dunaliella salina]